MGGDRVLSQYVLAVLSSEDQIGRKVLNVQPFADTCGMLKCWNVGMFRMQTSDAVWNIWDFWNRNNNGGNMVKEFYRDLGTVELKSLRGICIP